MVIVTAWGFINSFRKIFLVNSINPNLSLNQETLTFLSSHEPVIAAKKINNKDQLVRFLPKTGTTSPKSDFTSLSEFFFSVIDASTKFEFATFSSLKTHVINKVQEEFINNGGPGEGILSELQGLWELKMMQAGAIVGPIDRSVVTKSMAPGATSNTVHDLNVPYEGLEEYETPTVDLLFPPTPLQNPMQTPLPVQTPLPGTAPTPLPGTMDNYNIPTRGTPITPSVYPSINENGVSDGKSGRPNTYMASASFLSSSLLCVESFHYYITLRLYIKVLFSVQQPPSPWLNQRPPLDVNVVINGSVVNYWACINFSRTVPDSAAQSFCHQLVQMCQESGMEFKSESVVPVYSATPD
ncbi:unnamed protein product [Lactuca virosa]|uniref:Uncharacterized protein n=1 Tax=Lactuca virosa TaxID=75947 RepID=A0AAU9LDY1_9ASTR|nr:unnamed protein product [Lactuca virosa]